MWGSAPRGPSPTSRISSLLGVDPAVFGVAGVISGAAVVFFAFIGILGSLAIVPLLYMAVSVVITGTQSYTDIDPPDAAPLATAFDAVGSRIWASWSRSEPASGSR